MSIMLIWHPTRLLTLYFQRQEPIRTLRSCLKQKQSSQVMNLISLGIWVWVSHRSIGCKAAVCPEPCWVPKRKCFYFRLNKGHSFSCSLEKLADGAFSKYRRHLVGNTYNYTAYPLRELIGYTYPPVSFKDSVTHNIGNVWQAMQWGNKGARVTYSK